MILINGKKISEIKYSDVKKFLKDSEESFFVEYKENNVTNRDLIKEICAFSNTFGGYIFLGVNDDGLITGCQDWTEERINNSIRDLISPIPAFEIKELHGKSNKIFVIKIEEGTMPPYITNKGVIYERVSSGSFPVKDSSTINRILDKKRENLKKIENKICIAPIDSNIYNVVGYIDHGFSIVCKDYNVIINRIIEVDFQKLSDIIKQETSDYSISKVGRTICITIGETKLSGGLQVPGGINNFMEILPDGSFRSRIILADFDRTGIVSVNHVLGLNELFKKIYSFILKKDLSKNMVEARSYEKLTTLRVFETKFTVKNTDPYYEDIEKYYYSHKQKYGACKIVNSNRVPLNDFAVLDKGLFESNHIEFNDDNIVNKLFPSDYYSLGYIDDFSDFMHETQSNSNE